MPATSALDRSLSRELGPRTGKALGALGLVTVGDLLRHYPRRWVRRGELTDLSDLVEGEHVTVMAEVVSAVTRPMRARRGELVEAVVTDGTGRLRLAFFAASPHQARWRLSHLAPGRRMLFAGKVDRYRDELQLAMPAYEEVGDDEGRPQAQARVETPMPLYPASARVASWSIARSVRAVLATLRSEEVPDPLPAELLARRRLPTLADAFVLLHEPTDDDQWRRALSRFVYEEAFVLQVALARRRAATRAMAATPRRARGDGLLAAFDARLPFALTAGQVEVGQVLTRELASEHPMNRLLQGEVGSGKTVVALRAMLTVVDAGGQAALLAPTEVLAMQHHRTITAMLGGLGAAGTLGADERATRVALLTGSQPAAVRRRVLDEISTGPAGLVVGTHALLGQDVSLRDLGLVVVDEQHRFGVEQRELLRARSGRPAHLLVMTATPIPRTVAMTVFGDLDVSTLAEVPAGRRPITTHVVPGDRPAWVERVWARVREECQAGRQVYVVCPRIGGTEVEEPPGGDEPPEAAQRPPVGVLELAELLRGHPELTGLRLGVLHGRLAGGAKDAVMTAFDAGEVDVLVSTTVVEVGVDVPNATCMVVMDADRFGISQLHQLRGRVGRGQHPGLCLLVTSAPPGSPGRARLDTVAATLDGFALSRADLASRREGDVLGSAQSGARTGLRLLRVTEHEEVIADAREEAAAMVAADPELAAHQVLAQAIGQLVDPAREAFLERG